MSKGQLIAGRFEINNMKKDLLGRGGMGDVYRGKDTQTGQIVAIKALRNEVITTHPNLVARFTREGEALRQLNHPNIVGMVATVEETDLTSNEVGHYLVMEYVEGGSLRERMDEQRALSISRVLEISLELADALTRAHHLGIIHRDLKPANVLLAEDGTPRLSDFGVAHMAESPRLTQTGMLVGSIDYLSPEACNGEVLDARADIWSFGVMLYEMLTRVHPFRGGTLSATLTAILTQPVPDLAESCPSVPDALADLVYRSLEKDRHQRIPTIRLVGAELDVILAEMSDKPSAVSGQRSAISKRFATPTPKGETVSHNLPIETTPFVGREGELIELARLLADPGVRLLTILGAGGMGKTRLALEAATRQLEDFKDGVFFVSLAPLASAESIVTAVAEAIGLSFNQGGEEPRQQLINYLRHKQMLLVMDNFEHLLVVSESGGMNGVGIISNIPQTALAVKILATSRTRLNVSGEHRFQIGG